LAGSVTRRIRNVNRQAPKEVKDVSRE
jgi:hypothetical protein